MDSKEAKPPTAVRAAVITMNPHEAAAVMDAAQGANWQQVGERPDALGAAGFMIREFHSPDSRFRFDHIDLNSSGNLVAAMLAERFLGASAQYDAIIMFGCAGMNRGAAEALGLKLGSVVLVDKAQYAENGRVYVDNYPPNERVERVSIKGDRFQAWRVELSSGLTRQLGNALGLQYVSALCVDKVLQLDPKAGLTQPPSPDMEYNYTDLLSTTKYHVVDMESFGFLWALGTRTRNTAVIRVITDDLSSHAQSTQGSSHSPEGNVASPNQELLLRQHAPVVLEAIEAFPLGTPTTHAISVPSADEPTAQDVERELSSALFDSVRMAALASGTPASAAKQFVAWLPLLPPRMGGGGDSALDDWFRDMLITNELGYGTHSLARRTEDLRSRLGDLIEAAVTEHEDRVSQLDPSRIEPLKRSDYRDHVAKFTKQLAREVDPTSGRSRYEASLRLALKRLGFPGLIVRSGGGERHVWAQITLPAAKAPLLRLIPWGHGESHEPTEIRWQGWQDDTHLQTMLERL